MLCMYGAVVFGCKMASLRCCRTASRHAAVLPHAVRLHCWQNHQTLLCILPPGKYGAVVFGCEVVGVTAVLLYCLMLPNNVNKSSCCCCQLMFRYGAVVFGCEVVGVTAVLPYCLMLLRRCCYVGQDGLPPDNGRWKLPKDKRFTVRVLVPCYKVRCSASLIFCS
jgi:hypothetical protein